MNSRSEAALTPCTLPSTRRWLRGRSSPVLVIDTTSPCFSTVPTTRPMRSARSGSVIETARISTRAPAGPVEIASDASRSSMRVGLPGASGSTATRPSKMRSASMAKTIGRRSRRLHPRLHQARDRPALRRLPRDDHRPQHVDRVEDDARPAQRQHAVGHADAVDRDDRRAGLFEAHAVEDDAAEQIAADAGDRDLRVEQPLGADDDVAAQPVAEPARLRDAEQAEHDRDDEDGREVDEATQPPAPAARRPLASRLERRGRRVAQAHRSIILQPWTKCTAKKPARR